jgi:hypothetical protein
VRARGIDRVFREITPNPEIVVLACLAESPSGEGGPQAARSFITCAVCRVRAMTSPTRPMAWESEDIMLIAPRSCSTSSAAIVSGRMRDSANATSSGTCELRWWQTSSMSDARPAYSRYTAS